MNEKFGVREIVDVVFKAKSAMTVGNTKYKKGEPVIYFDSAKTSTLESTTATVYLLGKVTKQLLSTLKKLYYQHVVLHCYQVVI